jgi:hypothetical protein
MRRPDLRLASLLIIAATAAPARAAGPEDAILGTWRGTSTCVDLKRAPACKDEVVVYDFRPSSGTKGGVTLDAKKVVDGVAVSMGELELTLDPGTSRWSGEFQNSRVHVVWSYKVNGNAMTGTCEEFASKAVLRRVAVKREEPAPR